MGCLDNITMSLVRRFHPLQDKGGLNCVYACRRRCHVAMQALGVYGSNRMRWLTMLANCQPAKGQRQ